MRDKASKLIGAAIALGLFLNFAIAAFDRLNPAQAAGPQPVILFGRDGRPIATSKHRIDGSVVLMVEMVPSDSTQEKRTGNPDR